MNIQFSLQSFNDILFILLGVCFLIQSLYYLTVYVRVASYKPSSNKANTQTPLSVIICARNEAINLQKNLTSVLEQDYPNFEVVVVNDCSEDDSDMVLAELKQKYGNLKVTSINPDRKFSHGKKLAVTIGIKAATNDWLVFTDADCRPVSDKWLQEYANTIDNKYEIIIGYGGYEPRARLLNNYLRYDTFFIALQYLGFALAGNPYMGVGRNMAYKKELFFKSKGFARHYHLASGDDDLFINENAKRVNTKVLATKESFTISEPNYRFKDWIKQKKRHLTTYKLYKGKHKFLLFLEPFTRTIFYAIFIYLLIKLHNINFILAIFITRFIIQFIIFVIAQNKLNEKNLWLTSVFYDVFSLIINFGIDLSNRLSRRRGK